MKKIVISGVNMVQGGILTIYQDVIRSLGNKVDCEVFCLVHDESLFNELPKYNNVRYISFPEVKKSWIKRLAFEFYTSRFLSKKIKPDIWLSLHDISAFVDVKVQYVYCHNPSPFYRAGFSDFKLDKKFFLFTKFYKYLYRLNIKSNKNVFVQQKWIAENFKRWYGINNLIVAKPEYKKNFNAMPSTIINDKYIFLYPSVPRVFKNYEVIINAMEYLRVYNADVYNKVEIHLTFNYGINSVGDYFMEKVKNKKLSQIKFIGFLSKPDLVNKYANLTDALLFPSKLETWGLPISEAKNFGLPILLPDLPYAYETAGDYKKVAYFKCDDYIGLAMQITSFLESKQVYSDRTVSDEDDFFELDNWDDFASFILK